MDEFTEVLRSLNIDLRKPAPSALHVFRVYIVLDDSGFPLTLAGEWCFPSGDRHITAMWIPPLPEREFLFIQAITLATILWNSYMSNCYQESSSMVSSFSRSLSLIKAVNEYKTI